MPIFDFECEDCGEVEERLVSLDEKTSQVCTKCGELMMAQMGIPCFRPFPEYAKNISALGGEQHEIGGFRDMKRRAANNWDGDQHEPLVVDQLPTASERKAKISGNEDRNRKNLPSKKLA